MSFPVEIKANVESSAIDAAMSSLGLAADDAEDRSIYFLEETSDGDPLALYARGVILRLRSGAGGDDDCTVKFRPCDVSRLPPAYQESSTRDGSEFRIEEDWTGAHHVLSASLVADRSDDQKRPAAPGQDPSAFTPDQLELFHGYTSRELRPELLRPLGPINARKWKIKLGGHKVNCEEWNVGAGLRFFELSGRADDADSAGVLQPQLLNLFSSLGVSISATPELKTKLVLDYFSKAANPPA